MEKEKDTQEHKRKGEGLVNQILLSAVAVLIGAVLLFVPQIEVRMLCYALCVALIALGIVSLARFFLSETYKKLQDAHFATGIMLLILGICCLLRIDDLTAYFTTCTGIIALILGTLILQNTVRLKILDSPLWIAQALLSAVILLGVIPVLTDLQVILSRIRGYEHWIFFLSGVLCLLSLLIAWIGLKTVQRRENAGAGQTVTADTVTADTVPADTVPADTVTTDTVLTDTVTADTDTDTAEGSL